MDFRELGVSYPIFSAMSVWENSGRVYLSFDTYLDYMIYSWLDKEDHVIEYCNLNDPFNGYNYHRVFVTDSGPILSFSFVENNSQGFKVMEICGKERDIITKYADYIEIRITSGIENNRKFKLPADSDKFFKFLDISFFNSL